MNKNNNIKIYVTIAILASLASIFSVLDKIIIASLFPYIPGIKIGLANIITSYNSF